MKFIFATIHVKNLEDSIRFYEEVIGLKLVRRFPGGPKTEIAFLADGPAELELICNKDEELSQYGEYPSLGFEVDDLDQAMEVMKAQGVEIVSGPIQPNPKTRFFFIQDPDGLHLEIIEQK
ncbi:VOC family protein [Faecalicatena sp. AGMB00832]|uniref:VOC family protein n=1 Tax=Faecalicatena faecalis TaxID=2726362 RepID=A0ABS6D0K1_9FIRM|nr:VOC family protein [Faecalicatena faecalis]MBU3875033.1 VOC family protein [Faecalicatena faecalis]